jgi:8-oxo-dGTP pyrophosphatase MutT (NUDIX family)
VTLHDDAVATLSEWDAPDAGQARLRDDFLGHLAANDDGMWRSCVPGHLTASALVLSASLDRVLLTLHPKAKLWLQMGGHCEPADVSLAAAALREATEESGLEGLALAPVPLQLDRHAVWCHGGSFHLDVEYVAVAPTGARERISDESERLAWFPLDGLPEPTDDALRGLVTRAARYGTPYRAPVRAARGR